MSKEEAEQRIAKHKREMGPEEMELVERYRMAKLRTKVRREEESAERYRRREPDPMYIQALQAVGQFVGAAIMFTLGSTWFGVCAMIGATNVVGFIGSFL